MVIPTLPLILTAAAEAARPVAAQLSLRVSEPCAASTATWAVTIIVTVPVLSPSLSR